MSKNKQVFSGIGGQAIMEGIMMRNRTRYAAAIRKPDGEIEILQDECHMFSEKHRWAAFPFIRGVFSFVDSLKLGMKTLMWSASFAEEDPSRENTGKNSEIDSGETAGGTVEKKPAESQAAAEEPAGLSKAQTIGTVVIALVFAIGLFALLPAFLGGLLNKAIHNSFITALAEGIIRLLIFIAYVAGISFNKDIRRVYMYHGSEHKCINCLEKGLPLTVENVMASSKEHKRCGTSFMLIVMLISIILFMFIRVESIPLRLLSRLLLIPVVASLSFELLQFTGRHDNTFTWVLSRPGMWLQGLTTKEPEADMCEVAIAAVEKVFDWRQFLKDNFDHDIPGTP